METKTSYRLTRMRAGLTQIEAAIKAGIGQGALSAIETGRSKPGADTLIKLADVYACSVDELLGRAKAAE